MRILISVFVLSLLAACSTTGFSKYSKVVGPFKVVGQGPTAEAARQDGFKKAIELDVDWIMNLGSDDLLHPSLLELYEKQNLHSARHEAPPEFRNTL
jgi:hypothetical protein